MRGKLEDFRRGFVPGALGPPQLVIPAKAGIQYAGKAVINPIGRGVLGRPVLVRNCAQGRAMTAESVAPDCLRRMACAESAFAGM